MEEARKKPPSEAHVNETNNKRRKLSAADNEDFRESYFKIRVLVRRLRPHFMQVLQTPDFRNCKAALEIRKNLKLVLDLYNQMIVETDPYLSGENVAGEQAPVKVQEGKDAELLKTDDCVEKSTDIKHRMPSGWKLNDDQFRGSYIVGGSAFGSNFITYGCSKLVYYGPTKESYLSRRMKS